MNSRPRISLDAPTLLACIPLFSGLKPEHLRELGTACKLIELPGHRSIFKSDQAVRHMHYLVSGSVKRFTLSGDKSEKVLELVQAGHLFALSETLIGKHYASFAETLEPCVVLAIDVSVLHELLTSDAAFAARLLNILAQQHYATEFDTVRYRSLSVTQRVLDYLLSLAGDNRNLAGETNIRLSASKRITAARLGMAPETFSRTLRQLSDDGVIVVEGRTVHIQNATLAIAGRTSDSAALSPIQYRRSERGEERELPSPGEIINLCGRYRMLSQRITITWILLMQGLSKQSARVAMRKFREEFQRNLVRTHAIALPEFAQESLRNLTDEWHVFVELLARQPADINLAAAVFRHSETLLERADELTRQVVTWAGGKAVQLVNTAGRNRMLCARISKLHLFARWGIEAEQCARLVTQSIQEFEANMALLAQASAVSNEARSQLQIDGDRWQHFVANIQAADTALPGHAHALSAYAAGEELLRHLDTTVKLYERLARQPKVTTVTKMATTPTRAQTPTLTPTSASRSS